MMIVSAANRRLFAFVNRLGRRAHQTKERVCNKRALGEAEVRVGDARQTGNDSMTIIQNLASFVDGRCF
jgi:hypothetical protein